MDLDREEVLLSWAQEQHPRLLCAFYQDGRFWLRQNYDLLSPYLTQVRSIVMTTDDAERRLSGFRNSTLVLIKRGWRPDVSRTEYLRMQLVSTLADDLIRDGRVQATWTETLP